MIQQALWRFARPPALPLPPKTDGLLEDGGHAIPVRITITQNGTTIGWDDGALGFEEDAAWSSGRACSFRIGAQDVLPGTYACSGVEAVTDAEAIQMGLPLRHPTREVWVQARVLAVEGRKEWEDEARLAREVRRLRTRTTGKTDSLYPPLAPRPGLLPKPMSSRLRVALAVARVSAASLFLYTFPSAASPLMFVAFFLLRLPADLQNRAFLRRLAAEEAATPP